MYPSTLPLLHMATTLLHLHPSAHCSQRCASISQYNLFFILPPLGTPRSIVELKNHTVLQHHNFFFFLKDDPEIYFLELLRLECSYGIDISPRALSSPTSAVFAVSTAVPCLRSLVIKCIFTSMGPNVPPVLKEFSKEAATKMNNSSRSLITSITVIFFFTLKTVGGITGQAAGYH